MKRTELIVFLAHLISVAGFSQTVAAQQRGIDLQPEFTPGQTLQYRSRSTIKHETLSADHKTDQPTRIETESGMQLHTLQLREGGGADVEWTLRYIVIKTSQMVPGIPAPLDYDSREPAAANSPLGAMFGQLVGRTITISVDRHGRVLQDKNTPAAPSAGVLDQLMGGFFSKEMFEQLPFFVTAGAPSPAHRGARWKQTTAVTLPLGAGSIQLDATYRLKHYDLKKHTAQIGMTGRLIKTPPAKNAPPNALDLHKSQIRGAIEWDIALGRLQSAQSNMDLDADIDRILGRMRIRQEVESVVELMDHANTEAPE